MTRLIAIIMAGIILAGCMGGESTDPHRVLKPNDAALMLNEETGIMLVDVRTPEEFKTGFIKGAVNIPLDELDKSAKKKLPDKDQTIMLYCKSGKRSAVAAEDLLEQGYTSILEIEGGITAWKGMLVKPEK